MKDLFLWLILPLVLAEAVLVAPWLAERLLRWGARRLPEEYQVRYVDDWLGELDAVPGSLLKLAFAIRVLVGVPATERALTGRDALWVMVAMRLLTLLITGLQFLQFLTRVRRLPAGRAPDQPLIRRSEDHQADLEALEHWAVETFGSGTTVVETKSPGASTKPPRTW
jgi:hypothetical protein